MADPEKVIIIGNGFDLNLELASSYSDFIKSRFFSRLLDSNKLAQYLNEKFKEANWVDIESELKKYSKLGMETVEEDFRNLSLELVKYLSKIDTGVIKKDSDAYSLIVNNYNSNVIILDFNYTDSIERILVSLGIGENEIKNNHIKVHGSLKKKYNFWS